MGFSGGLSEVIGKHVVTLGLACVAASLLAGCSDSPKSAGTQDKISNAISGVAKGGTMPIVGATVTLWQTQSVGYPSVSNQAVALATTTTGSGGYFAFNPSGSPYNCSPGQYTYITATGGNTGGPSVNNQSVLMAPLGSCSNFQTAAQDAKITVAISEVTTVAAAYALGNFMYVGGSPGSQFVYITAPANNNSSSPGCTGSGTTLACTANGLGHAFANAANLADAVSFDSSVRTPSGAPFSVSPSNAMGSVPQALLNTLANILESCVNTTGGLSTDSGGGGRCGTLFADATPPGGSAPVNTLQAAVDMAEYPTHNASILFGLSPSFATFQPSLSAAPKDLSVGVVYAGTGSTAFGYPSLLALDTSDDVLVVTQDAAVATRGGVAGLTSSGGKIFDQMLNTSGVYVSPGQASTDTIGHVWVSDNDAAGSIRGINIADGSVYTVISSTANNNPATPALVSSQEGLTAVGVDRANNLWTCRKGGTSTYEITYTAGSTPTYALGVNGTLINGCVNVAFDNNQNVWFSASNGTTGAVGVDPNQTVGSMATYPASGVVKNRSNTTLLGIGGTAINSAGVGYSVTPGGVFSETPTVTSNMVTALGAPVQAVAATLTTPTTPAFDGSGTLFFSDAATGGSVYQASALSPTSGTLTALSPCYAPSSGSVCASVSPASATNNLQIDSAGSIWLASGANGAVVEIIGTAAPAPRSIGTVSGPENTSTVLSVSNTTPQYGTPVTLTASVSPSSATGTVTFFDGGSNLGSATLNSGVATLVTSTLPLGSQSLTAMYVATTSYAASTSNAVAVSVSIATTSTVLSSSTVAAPVGTPITLSARVSPAVALGMVTFYDGSNSIGSAQIQGGVASFTTTSLSDATHYVTATYGGSATYSGSTSNTASVVAYNTAYSYLADDYGPTQQNAEVVPNTAASLNTNGLPSGSFVAGPSNQTSYINPYWFVNQTNSPQPLMSNTMPATNCAAAPLWSYGDTASSICWIPTSSGTGYQVQIFQNGAPSTGAQLACNLEYNNFFGPNNYVHQPGFTNSPPLTNNTSLHLRFNLQLQSAGTTTLCSTQSQPTADHTTQIIDLTFRSVPIAGYPNGQTLFYQLVMSSTNPTKANSCTGSQYFYASQSGTGGQEYGVDDYYGSTYGGGACPTLGGPSGAYDVDIIKGFKLAINSGQPGLDSAIGDWSLSGMYIGSIVFGGGNATSTWSGINVVAYQ